LKNSTFFTFLFFKANKYCALSIFFFFFINSLKAQLRADFSSDTNAGCAPLVVNFKDSSNGNPSSWFWDLGNGTVSNLQNPSDTYFDPGTYTIKLIIKNSFGIDSIIKTKYITVYSSPVVNFTGNPLSGCFPLNTQFTDQSIAGSGSITKWEWDFGDGNSSNLQNPAHIYTAVGNFNISARATNSFGCISSKTKAAFIQIGTGAKAQFSNSIPNSCNAPVTINFNSSGSLGSAYEWIFGDGTTSTSANPSHTYTSSGSFSVMLIVKNSSGCSDTLLKPNLITIGNTKADFSIPATVCQEASFNATNTSTPPAGSSFWDFGDGTFSDSLNPSKIYANAGNYVIKMVANFGACKDSASNFIQVISKPIVNFSATPTVSCTAPLTVNFTNTSSGGVSYFWDFGDGNTSNIENASHIYLTEGTYTVKLVVINASGCKDSIVKSNLINIKKPVISIDNLPDQGCGPLQHTFTASVNSVDSISNYFWNFGDGSSSASISPTHVYNAPGHYTITLTFRTSGGCTDSVKAVDGIVVGSKSKAGFSANPLTSCATQNITFTDLSTGNPNQWIWFFGDGSSSGSQNPQHQYNDTGYFSVTLIALNNGCADTVTVPDYIYIKPPIARFSYSKTCELPKHVVFTDQSIGADSWNWNFGDGNSSSIQNPVHDFTSPGNYSVALTVTNSSTGCSFTVKNNIQLINEVADFISSDSIVCKNSPVTFTASNSNAANISSYTWRFGDGVSISDSTNSITHIYTKPSDYNVTLILKDINGCIDSITKSLSIQVNGPTSSFRSAIAGACTNATVNFIDSSYSDGIHPIQQWKWNWGDGSSQNFTAPPFTHTYGLPGNYSVLLQVTDSKGCTDSILKPNAVTISKPEAVFSADTLFCTFQAVNFYNSSTGPGLVYSWDFGDGNTSNLQNPVHLYTAEGTYSVTLNIKDIYGCTGSVSKNNYVKIANPKADFKLSDSIGSCPPLVINFTNTSTGYSNAIWDFGDGNTSSAVNPSHFYSTAGIFNVTLTISIGGGCITKKTKQIKITGPTGSFSYLNNMGCDPLETQFKANTGKNISFIWDFSDGTTVPTSDSVISHVYTTPGAYLPKMILVDTSGCRVPITGTDTIKVFGIAASFNHSDSMLCDSGTVQFTNTSTSNDLIVNYLWNFGDGTTSATANPLHGYNQPGTYNTSLAVTTQKGCKDTVDNLTSIRINPSPKISIQGNASACVPAVLNFSGIISNPDTSTISWKWDFANGNISTQQNPAAQNYSSAGTFTIKAIASSTNGCTDTVSKIIDIYPLPSLTTSADEAVCAGASASLKVSGAQSYFWSPAAYLSCSNCASPISQPDVSIKYFVKGTSDKGCISTDSVYISVKLPFKLSVSKGESLCLGKSVQLNASGTDQYIWTPSSGLNNPSISSPSASPANSTTYQVIGSDSKGCFKDTGYVSIKVFPMPVVNAGKDKTINVGQQVEIIPEISNDVTIVLWTPSTGIISDNTPGITVKPSQSVEYTIQVKNVAGCTAQDKISVFVLCNDANIFVPNTFSPNGDGANDIFYPRGSGVFKIKNIKVFNRWGEVVFEKSNFNANDASAGWDGTYKGAKLPPDVFVYMLDVICENNTNLIFKGNIALIK